MTDTHCHLADAAFAGDLADVVARARQAGVDAAICVLSADEADEIARAADVAAAWPAVRFAAGVHPHRAGAHAGAAAAAVESARSAVHRVGAVAVGEIGLDYHYDFAPRATQRDVFAAQVALAGQLDLPVVVHTRESTDDAVAILRDATPPVRGVMHCFTGTRDQARLALDLGFYVSLSGILTFPKAGALRDVAAFVPVDRLLVETDAPFLAPAPHRGARNEPAWVVETAKVLAAARGIDPHALARALDENTAALFGAWRARTHAPCRRVDTSAKPVF